MTRNTKAKNSQERNKELTFLSQGVRFRGHVGGIRVWSLQPPLLSSKRRPGLVRGKTNRGSRSGRGHAVWTQHPIPRRVRRGRASARAPPSRVPGSGQRETSDFSFAGGPPSAFCSTSTQISQPGGTGRGWDTGVPTGHSGSCRATGQRRGGSGRRAARWRRPSPSEWRLQEGRARAEVHTARLATLKPVPWTAPWRRRCRVRPHAGVSADAITLPKRPRTRLAICQAGERSCAEVDDNQLSRQSGGGKTGNLCLQVGGDLAGIFFF